MRKTLIVFACVILCSSFAGAQTTESVCDGEQGAAYGLCNAFCDAMDCDGDDPQASETACDKVQSKFEQVTGHQPPCLAPPPELPCVCKEELTDFLAVASAPVVSCSPPTDGHVVVFTAAGSVEAAGPYSNGAGICFIDASFGGFLSITLEQGVECVAYLRSLCP